MSDHPQNSVIMYGAAWCGDCHRAKAVFEQYQVDYEYRDTDVDETRDEMLGRTDGRFEIPTLVFPNGQIVQNPDNAALVELIKPLTTKETMTQTDIPQHDLIIVGAGPAALTAAIYTTREDIETLLFERGVIGGLAAVTDLIDNYPGFPQGVEGLKLADNLREQAERFGAVIELGEVTAIHDEGALKRLETTSGEMHARAVLIATGSDYKKIGVPGEQEFYARGVHYCATCDGAFYRDKRLVVVGGGNSAVQEAMFLTRYATHIDLLVRGDKFRASDVLQKDLENHKDKITVHFNTTTDEIVGEGNRVTSVTGTDKTTGKKISFETDGVFVFVGLEPNSQFLKASDVKLDEIGFVITDQRLQTSIPGVFAAGDIRCGATMQIASAAGEGATAALTVREYLEGRSAHA
ncbi:MAG TPA: FAD-dependent oxidoreductase [Candidatus Limnocylindrales bacterium]|nr:FAD-dependent oxidoreductase [Candidatus Limnocylindrales bacterium]